MSHVTPFTTRIDTCFKTLEKQRRAGLVTFITAGDPDYITSLEILKQLPNAGSDIIELGMPFSDPMADGPAIQLSSQRALQAGQTLKKTLEMVHQFRQTDQSTPIVLMGYYNPIYVYSRKKFLEDACNAGVDGLIIVDLPPEADDELCIPTLHNNMNFIRLTTPTTDKHRLPKVLQNTSGFLYHVSIAGITGTKAPDLKAVKNHVIAIKSHTNLPIAVGFGVKTAEQVREFAQVAEAVVVGSAIVTKLNQSLDSQNKATKQTIPAVTDFVRTLSMGVRIS
ncbi:MAG: tryptophan synthase subunit alpha [Pseudomonadota bacterium]